MNGGQYGALGGLHTSSEGREGELRRLAWQASSRTSAARLKKVADLERAVRQGNYRIDFGRLGSVLLHPDDLKLTSLMCRCPALLAEHVARYGRRAAGDLLVVLETRDRFTGKHSARVTALSVRFARYLGLSAGEIELLRTSGYLHDLGKVEIPQSILRKQGRLSPAERAVIEGHPGHGVRIAGPLHLARQEQEIILHHHEQWDGRGYPKGLKGQEIPLLSRLVSLADVFEALTSDRPHRRRLASQEALRAIADRGGSQFDPVLTREFLGMMAKEYRK